MSPAARRLLFTNKKTDWGALLTLQCRAHGLPIPQFEVRFHPVRRWRFDAAWKDQRVAIEIEGGLYVRGRHVQGAGAEADMEKYAEALMLGWRVLRVSPRQLKQGIAVQWLSRLLLRG